MINRAVTLYSEVTLGLVLSILVPSLTAVAPVVFWENLLDQQGAAIPFSEELKVLGLCHLLPVMKPHHFWRGIT